MSYAYSGTDNTGSSISFNAAHNGANGLFTMADTLTVSGVFKTGLEANTGILMGLELMGINAQDRLASLPERYGRNVRRCISDFPAPQFTPELQNRGASVAAGQQRSFSFTYTWPEAGFRRAINSVYGSGGGTAYMELLADAIGDGDLTQEEAAEATPVRWIVCVAALSAIVADGYLSLPSPSAYFYLVYDGGEADSAFYAAYPAFDAYFAKPAAPVIQSCAARDDAAVSALETFGGYAVGHSVPALGVSFALDAHFATLSATHTLTLSGAASATLTAGTEAGATSVEFDLPELSAGTLSYVYEVEDGWGSASVSGSVTVYAYAPPSVSAFAATRYVEELTEGQTAYVADMSGERVWLDISAQVAPVIGENAWESTIEWWQEDDEANADSDDLSLSASDGQSISVTGNTAAGRGLFTQTLDAASTWTLRITFTDLLGNSGSAVATVDAGAAILDLEPYGVAVGMRSTATAADAGKFEVAEDWKVCGVFPVGAIYLSVDPTNPAAYFGGTWVSFGAGRVLVGVNTSETEFNTVEKTGGEKKHTLTVEEMPSHNHRLANTKTGGSGSAKWIIDSSGTSTAKIESTGGGQSHNNLQPYITCYMWKRTA